MRVAYLSLAIGAIVVAQVDGAAQSISSMGLQPRPLVELSNPCGQSRARFGESTAVGDFDGDGYQDVAVGAWGMDAVFVFYGGQGALAFSRQTMLRSDGVSECLAPTTDGRFGFHVAAGQLDADPQDELIVGAPDHGGAGFESGAVFVFGLAAEFETPEALIAAVPEAERIGIRVAIGDVDGDGANDVIAGAPTRMVSAARAGGVHVFLAPLGSGGAQFVLDNPAPVEDGNYGHDVVMADADGDAQLDLFVSAVGNTGNQIRKSGQIYWYMGPFDNGQAAAALIEDPFPDPNDLPSPRFGMDIDARAGLLTVGANRKDWNGVMDAGLGLVYTGPAFQAVTTQAHPDPRPADFLAFRTVIANVVGDSALDVVFAVLPNQSLSDPNSNGLLVWDGNDLTGTGRFLVARPRSGSHFANGLVAADVYPGGYEELVVGDPTFDVQGRGLDDDTGRVFIYAF